MIRHYSDEELIDGLRARKKACIDYLYQEFFPPIRHYLLRNSGNEQDVEDLFQDTLVVLYKQCQQDGLIRGCSLKTYFMAISRNLWLQRLERKYRLLYQADFEVHESRHSYSPEDQDVSEENLELQRIFYKNLMELPGDCRRLLQLYCLKIPYREIARLMNYKDEIYVKTRKYSCKKMLRRRIMNDPECQKLLCYEGKRNYLGMD
jgi:RNA polymerase sigma factor (sigma-70 family)